MELLETQDPEKRRLIETSDRHKRELEKEVKSISDNTEKILKNALIIGGVLAITYFTISQLSSSKKKKKAKTNLVDSDEVDENQAPSLFSQIGSKVVDTATIVLLDLAKDALAEYLKNRSSKDGDS